MYAGISSTDLYFPVQTRNFFSKLSGLCVARFLAGSTLVGVGLGSSGFIGAGVEDITRIHDVGDLYAELIRSTLLIFRTRDITANGIRYVKLKNMHSNWSAFLLENL